MIFSKAEVGFVIIVGLECINSEWFANVGIQVFLYAVFAGSRLTKIGEFCFI